MNKLDTAKRAQIVAALVEGAHHNESLNREDVWGAIEDWLRLTFPK